MPPSGAEDVLIHAVLVVRSTGRFKPSQATPGSGAVGTSPPGENRPIIWGGKENGPGRLGSPGPKSWEVLQLNVATDAYMGGIAGHVSHPVAPSNLRAITQGGPRGAVRPKASECEWVPLALPIGQRQDFFVACDLSHRAGPRDGPTVFSADLERWALMSRNMLAWISAEKRFLGLNAGDWTILLAGFALVGLLAFLL